MSKLVTTADLQNRTMKELQELLRMAYEDLAQSATGSAARRNALVSLANICRAIRARQLQQPKPAPRL